MIESRSSPKSITGTRSWRCATASASRSSNGIQVIKEAELPLEVSRQGLMRWYLHPAIKDTCLSVLLFYQQEIPPGSRSGRLKFQGGQVMMITEGQGYTHDRRRQASVEGRATCSTCRCAPTASSCSTSTPIRKNPPSSSPPSRTGSKASSVDRGCGFEQLEDAPEYRTHERRDNEHATRSNDNG